MIPELPSNNSEGRTGRLQKGEPTAPCGMDTSCTFCGWTADLHCQVSWLARPPACRRLAASARCSGLAKVIQIFFFFFSGAEVIPSMERREKLIAGHAELLPGLSSLCLWMCITQWTEVSRNRVLDPFLAFVWKAGFHTKEGEGNEGVIFARES